MVGSDINSTACCPNTDYCIVNSTTWEAKCCALGSTCGGSCSPDRYLVNVTTTATVSSSATVETLIACAARKCVSTNYACPSSMGGNCCSYGMNCGYDSDSSQGVCLATATSSSATSSATGTATATGDIVQVPDGGSQGLSTGAKAGIAVGVIVVAAVVIGALTWMCIRRRHRSGHTTTGTVATAQEMDVHPNQRAVLVGATSPRAGDAGAAGQTPSEVGAGGGGGVRPYRAGSYGPHLSEVDGQSSTGGYAPSSSHGGEGARLETGADYFGPAGAYHYQHQRAASPGNYSNPGAAAAHNMAPSSHPGSEAASQTELADTSSAAQHHHHHPATSIGPSPSLSRRHEASASSSRVRDSIAGRFELYGGDVPLSPRGAQLSTPGAATTSDGGEVYHDAPEERALATGASSAGVLPQPFPTPGSEMSEFATPSPMSRDEPEHVPRREV